MIILSWFGYYWTNLGSGYCWLLLNTAEITKFSHLSQNKCDWFVNPSVLFLDSWYIWLSQFDYFLLLLPGIATNIHPTDLSTTSSSVLLNSKVKKLILLQNESKAFILILFLIKLISIHCFASKGREMKMNAEALTWWWWFGVWHVSLQTNVEASHHCWVSVRKSQLESLDSKF